MTKEELEKEAEKFLGGWLIDPEIVKLLVDFAEPREKRIADLEKENRTMRSEIGIAKGYIERIKKENAELKETLGKCAKMPVLYCLGAKETITKATEIIKKLYAVYYDPCVTESDLKYRDELFAEIKQFLNEVKK